MKRRQHFAGWLGFALAGGLSASALTTQAGRPNPPQPPPPPPPLTYVLVAFEDGGRAANYASGINEVGLVVGHYDYELETPDGVQRLSWPTAATRTDVNGNGLLDLSSELPVLPGHAAGSAWSVNENGLIVGESSRIPVYIETEPISVYCEGVVWVNAVPQGVGVIDVRLDQSTIRCVNRNGLVAGNATFSNTVNWQRAFIVVPEGTVENPIYFRDTNADGVNDLMLPIWPGPDPSRISWPFDPENPLTYGLQDPVAYITGLNDSGVICGRIDCPVALTPDPRGAFVIVPDFADSDGDGNPWFASDATGNNTLVRRLPALKAGAYTASWAINSAGEIAGVSADHAVLWKPQTGGGYVLQDLGTVASEEHMQIAAMSHTGWIVGCGYSHRFSHGVPKPPPPPVPVVWRNGVMYLVQDLLTNGSEWTVLRLTDVSDTGVLAGSGLFNGKMTACLAVPNLP